MCAEEVVVEEGVVSLQGFLSRLVLMFRWAVVGFPKRYVSLVVFLNSLGRSAI